jgi:hypothetical protein
MKKMLVHRQFFAGQFTAGAIHRRAENEKKRLSPMSKFTAKEFSQK